MFGQAPGEDSELAAIRPDLDGNQIMEIPGVGDDESKGSTALTASTSDASAFRWRRRSGPPEGRDVGRACRHLLELRMDHGPMSYDDARAALLDWWSTFPGAE